MKAQILKRMTSLGKDLEIGDIVDVSEWRHTKSLVTNRYIKIVEEEVKPKKATKKEKVEE